MGNAFIIFGRQRTEPDYGACQGALRQYKIWGKYKPRRGNGTT